MYCCLSNSRSSRKRPPKIVRLSGRLRAVVVYKKEGRKDGRMESGIRGKQTCSLTIYINMWTVSSDISIQRRHWQPLSVHLWAYCTHPTHDVNDVMCEGWPQHRGLRPLLFSNSGVGSFTSYKNQISLSAVKRDLRFSSLQYPKRLESLLVCRCHYKGSTFFSVI